VARFGGCCLTSKGLLPNSAADGAGIDVSKLISSLKLTVGLAVGKAIAFFFCDPPLGKGSSGFADADAEPDKEENGDAAFDSRIIACTIGFWDCK